MRSASTPSSWCVMASDRATATEGSITSTPLTSKPRAAAVKQSCVTTCVEINRCVGASSTTSAMSSRSSGEERHRPRYQRVADGVEEVDAAIQHEHAVKF